MYQKPIIILTTLLILAFIGLLLGNVIHWNENKKAINSSSPRMETGKELNKKISIQNKESGLEADETYITPTIFEIGLIKGKPFQAANNCLPNVLYPINALDVDYGSKMPSDCKCAQFVQAP